MFAAFTDDARELIRGAERTAEGAGMTAVTARHMLVAVVEGAPHLLALDSATTGRLRVATTKSAEPPPARRGLFRRRQVRLSRDAKQALEAAVQESKRLDTAAIGPAVLLLGVMATRDVRNLMHEVGIDAVTAQRKVEQAVGLGRERPR